MDKQPLDHTEADLKATAEDLVADARRVEAIEVKKTKLDANDPRVAELSAESEELTAKMAHKARVERALADEARQA